MGNSLTSGAISKRF